MPTNTACSSSLVAAHLGALSLQGDCQASLAAGVNAILMPRGASAAMTQVGARVWFFNKLFSLQGDSQASLTAGVNAILVPRSASAAMTQVWACRATCSLILTSLCKERCGHKGVRSAV